MITLERFQEICKKYEVKNACITLVENNKSYTYSYGYQDIDKNILLENDGIFRIASISKTVLAIGAMHLKEEGLLDLDKDISLYLGFPVRNPHYPDSIITTRMLMTQTSSITDGFDDEDLSYDGDRVDGYNGVNGRYLNVSLKEMLTPSKSPYYSDLTYSKYIPGEHFIYSNFGCGILACIIEKITGKNYDQYMKEFCFQKLGLDASYYAVDIKKRDKIVTLYNGLNKRDMPSFIEKCYPKAKIGESYLGVAGGLFISMPELSKIMMSFWKKDYQLLKDETIKKMMTVNWEGHADEYRKKGLQMIIMDGYAPFSLYGHFGSAYGLRSMMLFNKELETGVCFACSGGNINYRSDSIPSIHYDLIKEIWK